MTQAEPRWLDNRQQLAWRALLAINNRAFPEFERTFKEHGLVAVQYSIMVALSEAPGRTLRLTELADFANSSPSRLTHRLRDLVACGDIEISADPTDGRGKHATLTDRGVDRLRALAPLHVEDVQRILFNPLSAAQTAALAEALSLIAAGLCDHDDFDHSRSHRAS